MTESLRLDIDRICLSVCLSVCLTVDTNERNKIRPIELRIPMLYIVGFFSAIRSLN